MKLIAYNFASGRVDTLRILHWGQSMREATELDPLGYLRGLVRVNFIPDKDKWHSDYDPTKDEITFRLKFFKEPPATRVHIILHEAGHRGQKVDPKTFEEFKRRGLATLSNFKAMANAVHRSDYKQHGIKDLGDEAFAESYSRFAVGERVPDEIQDFWQERVRE